MHVSTSTGMRGRLLSCTVSNMSHQSHRKQTGTHPNPCAQPHATRLPHKKTIPMIRSRITCALMTLTHTHDIKTQNYLEEHKTFKSRRSRHMPPMQQSNPLRMPLPHDTKRNSRRRRQSRRRHSCTTHNCNYCHRCGGWADYTQTWKTCPRHAVPWANHMGAAQGTPCLGHTHTLGERMGLGPSPLYNGLWSNLLRNSNTD